MTAVSIVSAVAARIERLMNEWSEHRKSWWNDDATHLLSGLKTICKSLKDGNQDVKKVKEMVQLCYAIDDAIELAISSKHKTRTTSGFAKLIKEVDKLMKNTELPQQEESVSDQIGNPVLASLKESVGKMFASGHGNPEEAATSTAGEDMAVMMNKVSDQDLLIENKPVEPTEELDLVNKMKEALFDKKVPVVCIRGETGRGKTTLVKKVFYDRQVREYFKHFAWVPVNQDFRTKTVLEDILVQLLPETKKDIREGMDKIKLTQKIFNVQKKETCLVVLLGVEDVQDWQSIRVAFPITNTNSNTTIVITTTSKNVGQMLASRLGITYEMPPLTREHCNNILMENVKFNDADLKALGEIIFRLSQGSPVFAKILGNFLKDDPQLVREIDKYKTQPYQGCVLGLCYDRLPYQLKPCLLYLGQFPQGHNIEVDKLRLLLAAENIISPDDHGNDPSVIDMLQELGRRKLVKLQENNKYVRLHDQVRKFCISKGQDEEFFEIVDFANKKSSSHRLAIYLSRYKNGKCIIPNKTRSLLILGKPDPRGKSTWPSEINDLGEHNSLRVLDFGGVDLRTRKFVRGIDETDPLRYLSFRGCLLDSLPSSLSNLLYLETLDLRIFHGDDDHKMIISNIFSKMKRLRHLYLPERYKNDGKSKLRFQGLEKLITLVNFNTEECDGLSELNNVETITVISEGNPEELKAFIKFLEKIEDKLRMSSLVIRDFDCYTNDRVTMLKELLECGILQSLNIEGLIGELPEAVQISNNFVDMVFDGSELEDDDLINVLGKIKNLESLVLSNDAFLGDKIVFSAAYDQFPKLTSLKLQNLQHLKKVTFEKGAMKRLSALVIDECEDLEKVEMPKELDDSLQDARKRKGHDVYCVQSLLTITE